MQKKKLSVILACIGFVIVIIFGWFLIKSAAKDDVFGSVEQLNRLKYSIGVPKGSEAGLVAEKGFPMASIKYFEQDLDGYVDLKSNKLDAFVHYKPILNYMVRTYDGLAILSDNIGAVDVAVGISPGKKNLIPVVNEFIAKCKRDGTLEDMDERWFELFQDRMPDISKTRHPKMHLIIGVNSLIPPYCYSGNDGKLKGHNIEFIERLAYYMNADYELVNVPFEGLILGLQSGKLDMVVSNLNITKERRRIIEFSDPYGKSDVGVVVKNTRFKQQERDYSPKDIVITDESQLANRKTGVLTGSIFDDVLKKNVPTAVPVYFNNTPDMLIALVQKKIDGILLDEPMARNSVSVYKGVKMLDKPLSKESYAFLFAKGNDELRDNFNTVLNDLKTSGKLDEMDKKWFSADETAKLLPEELGERDNPIGTLKLSANLTYPPFCYVKNNNPVGYEIEIAHLVAKKLGYALEVQNMDFAAIIPSVVSGKSDFAASGISITEEREKSVLFSEPDYYGGIVIVVRSESNDQNISFFNALKQSFNRTFIQEDRYKMILSGLGITVLISFFSMVLGTILGCIVCILRRAANKLLNIPARVFVLIIQGTPILVLLLILYYVIFAAVKINAVAVAIIAFAINFAAYASEMFRTGLDAVDKGQTEAAISMGFKKLQVFRLIIMPQALKHILPVYKGLAIDLIKTTSIVGYVAIEDLTKVSDIIRSRTYEAFFPLISTAVVYFVLAYIVAELLKRFEWKLNPKYKKRIIKGIEVNDYANN